MTRRRGLGYVFALTALAGLSWVTVASGQANPHARRPPGPATPPGPELKDELPEHPDTPTPQFRRVGGPDAFGYAFSDQADGCAFQFIDISSTGTRIVDGDDTASAPVTLGAPFSLYGTAVTQLVMSSNGYLSADPADNGADFSNDCPLPARPSSPTETSGLRIYAQHDDLNLRGGTSAGYTQFFQSCPRLQGTPQACTVFQWNNVRHFEEQNGPTSGTWDLEAILYHASGEIVLMRTEGDTESGAGATIGLQSDQTIASPSGITYACNSPGAFPAGGAVCFSLPTGPDLEIETTVSDSEVRLNQPFRFTVIVRNLGPGSQSDIVVLDRLPNSVRLQSSSCTVSASGNLLRWDVGTLAANTARSCDLDVVQTTCASSTNEATVSASTLDSPGNNTDRVEATAGTGNVLTSSSFEDFDGLDDPAWDESSTNFETPLCTAATCGNGIETAGARSGDVWAWFGGASSFEEARLAQTVTIPPTNGTATLELFLWNGASGGVGSDTFEVTVDGTRVFQAIEGDSAYTAGYAPVQVDVSTFANGFPHEIELRGVQNSAVATNFSVDDVSLVVCDQFFGQVSFDAGIPTVDELGLGLLLGLLAAAGFVILRRRAK